MHICERPFKCKWKVALKLNCNTTERLCLLLVSYMLVLDQCLQLRFLRHTENHSYSPIFDDITRVLHLLYTHGGLADVLIHQRLK